MHMRLRLLDTFERRPDQTGLTWLLEELPRATRVLIGSGYFDAAVLDWLEDPLTNVIATGGEVHLTLGSNRGQTSRSDLERLLPLLAPAPARATLTVIYLPDVLFHPKAYFVRSPGKVAALIGSPNLTVRGLAQNLEASVALEAATPEPPLDAIEEMLGPGRYATYANAHRVRTSGDLDDLVAMEVIDRPRAIPPTRGSVSQQKRRAQLRRGRFPPAPMIPGLPPLPSRRRGTIPHPVRRPAGSPAAPAGPTVVVFVLARNDLKLVGTREISVPRAMRDWAEAVAGTTAMLGGGTIIEATLFARLASSPSAVTQSPTPGRLWVTGGGTGGTHFDVRYVLGNHVLRELNSQASVAYGEELGGGEIGVLELPTDPTQHPVRMTVYRPSDADYRTLDGLAVRTGRNQKRQAVIARPTFLPPWPY